MLQKEVLPALAARGIVVRTAEQLSDAERGHVRELFLREIFPVLTPLSTDPAHPFPHLQNKSLNLAVALRRHNDADSVYAVVQVPGVLPRFLPLPAPRTEGTAAQDDKSKGQANLNGDLSVRRPARPPVCSASPRARAHRHRSRLSAAGRRDQAAPARTVPRTGSRAAAAFRVTRDSEYELDDEVDDLLEEIEAHVRAGAAGTRCGWRSKPTRRKTWSCS